MTHWISPFRADKNIGRAINEAIANLAAGPDDWICHTDADTLFLRPSAKGDVEDILTETRYDIVACTMNRLGMPYQLVRGYFDQTDMLKHVEYAEKAWKDHGRHVAGSVDQLAAAMLCFRVSTWNELGGFDENRIDFDFLFCNRAKRHGYTLGIAYGIYIFHLYRMGKDVKDLSHLL